ncbi:uncharacterized protein LOC108109058 [Drosophila eugracilis]|uniref:uncharacterized protein LOC108109058 n=1 Tax=Drosophila eugracilis TaxID=29029 RepID=UPI0007E66E72|nr:uncharacterized protein LOC108109058 [Drosophila eugracilis]XP_017072870.1 uncharacterized protein LOC108109058 [Drosophila eugracilis]
MPRRCQRALELANLSAKLNIKSEETSDNDSDSEMDFPDDQEAEDKNEEAKNQPEHIRLTLENVPHFCKPNVNTGMLGQTVYNQKECESQVFPDCMVTVPIPVFLAEDAQTPRLEACAQRPYAHEEYSRQLYFYRSIFDKRTKKMKQREQKQEQRIYDVSLFDMAEHIARQENPFFRDSYDYYYTGGNLNTLPLEGGGQLAMHVNGDKLKNLHFSEINSEAEIWQPLHSAKVQEATSEIFELLPLKSWQANSSNTFLARCLNEVFLYELKSKEEQESEDYELVSLSKFSSQGATFVSASQSIGNASTLALACQDRSLRFVDITTQQDIAKHDIRLLKSLKQTTSNWAQLVPADGSTFHYLSQPVLITVDVRCDQPPNPCFASGVHSLSCENLTCMTKSVNPNLLYVGSNHKLHCLDIRCLGKKLADRAVVTWTHQMHYPPSFIDTFAFEGNEYIALAGVLPSDLRICQLNGCLANTVDEMFSPAIPFSPPTLEEALSDARLRGFVDVYADLPERIKSCTTGLRFHKLENASDNAFAQLLTANSLGDVHCQRLTLRDEEEHVQEIRTGRHTAEAINYYATIVHERVKRQSLRCTEVQSIPEIRDFFREAAKRTEPDEKPLIIEEIEIDYGIKDTDNSDDESSESAKKDTSTAEGKDKKKPKKKTTKKAKQQLRKKTPNKANQKKYKGINRGSWQKSAYQMSHYTDFLSIRLLDVWDMEEYDNTRDVDREMFHERLKDKELEPEHRMANWLDQLPSQPVESNENDETGGNPELVPGTNLPKLYDATSAEYSLISAIDANGEIKESPFTPKKELPLAFRHDFPILLPGQNTIIEPDPNPTPSKRPKIMHIAGF